jgi:predicted alpha/beta hydrolase family esterase
MSIFKNHLKIVTFTSIFLVFLLLLLLMTFQEHLIYPGIKREKIHLSEPFEDIYGSYYKKGSTDILWVFFGGNGSIPADFVDIIEQFDHSFLTITYPGYNNTPLKPSPETINNLVDKCLDKVLRKNKKYTVNFACYSIGCAAGINYLSTKKKVINKMLLFAPFWSLDEIVYSKYPFPKFIIKKLMNHNWENDKLKDIHPSIDVTILHGKNDELIHFSHSERLSKLRNCKLILTNDTHSSMKDRIAGLIKHN